MTETWLKNFKSGRGAAQRTHESKMIAVSSPDPPLDQAADCSNLHDAGQ